MSRTRVIVALLALLLAFPSAALGQGAGDEQYQDPFGGEQSQGGGGNGGGGNGGGGSGPSGEAAQDDDGLSDDPPVPDDGGDQTPADPADETGEADEGTAGGEDRTLPNTGSDPRLLAWAGLLFLLFGVGLRLRTVDPDDF